MDQTNFEQVSCSIPTLRQIDDLKDVPEEQLQWMLSRGSCLQIPKDEQFFKAGDLIDHLQIMLQGKTRFYREQGGQRLVVGEFEAPRIAGVLPYSRMTQANGFGVTLEDVKMFTLHREHFPEMIREHHELTAAFVHNMTNRVRTFTAFQQQNEKLMSLGKLSAGLAHELNNPSAAVVRSAQELKKHLTAIPTSFKQVISIRMSEEEVDAVNELLFQKIDALSNVQELSLMDRTEREDDLAAFLEDQGVEDGYELSENLVEFGFSEDDLQQVLDRTSADHFVPVMHWINNNLVTDRMVSEIEEASNRISELVSSVKSYSHMDQSQDKQAVDVHHGLKSTMTMLAHKVKKQSLTVEKDLQADLPKIQGYPGELNQVFTNILDNAIDALEGIEQAKLRIKTTFDGEFVRIYIHDNGPGIPTDVLNKIFDPFFTTKAIGKGTGMGLDVVKKIVDRHRGKVEVASSPGSTEFCICLPIKG